ncbi:MAG TPA: outer membrane protein transport protein [Spongiibacteraceae bacterium]
MKTTSITRSSALLLSTAISTTAFGAGFALNEQSARSLGQAFSGRASDADNASTVVGNPAGMSLLKQAEFSGGFVVIDAHTDIKDAHSSLNSVPTTGSNDGDMVPLITVPFAYYVQPLDEHWAAGIGIYAPFGLTTDYEDGFEGRYFGTKSELKIATVQPTISYKFDTGISLGLGITYNKITGELDKNAPLFGSEISAKVKGDDTAWGYNVGILYEINDKTRVGLTYFSKVDYTLEGHTTLENFPGGNQRFDASLDLTTPEKIDFGFTHQLTPELTLHGDATQTRWNRVKQITVKNDSTLFPTDTENLDWDNSWFYSLGLSYALNDQWMVRGGVAFDKSPIPDSTRSVRVPTSDRKEIAFGATWNLQQNVSLDFSYLYFKEDTAKINVASSIPQTGDTFTYSAKYHNYANLFGVQINWKL